METFDGMDVLTFRDVPRWEAWLAEHHELPGGVWLKIAKKGSGETSVTRAEATEVALCYGWIDSQARSYDEAYSLQRFSPRRPKGVWSQVNVDRVEALIAAGRMRAPGLAEIERAKADGRWAAAYPSPRHATVPDDLTAALKENAQAKKTFESLGKSRQYIVLLRLMTAQTPETRAARLRRMVDALAEGREVR